MPRDQIENAELALFKARQENYNQLLPILLPVDSMLVQPVKPELDDAIKKASLVPERHQNSKWVDNAYILIGRARLLKQDLPNAIEVFKYVNTKGTSEDDKHEALVGLMRAYVEQVDYPQCPERSGVPSHPAAQQNQHPRFLPDQSVSARA